MNQRPVGKPPRPLCPEHGCQLVVRSTLDRVRYLYCPVKGCKEAAAIPRTDTKSPVL